MAAVGAAVFGSTWDLSMLGSADQGGSGILMLPYRFMLEQRVMGFCVPHRIFVKLALLDKLD